jgi:hypothetical protein
LVTKDGTRLLPSKYQIDLFKFIEAGEGSAVVQAVAGSSKCLGPNVPVLMYTGEIKAAKNVRIGDLLMGPDSLPRKVLQLGDGMAPMYEVVPVKGAPWTCNDDHVLTLAGTNRFNGQTRDISVTEYLRLKREQRSFSRGWKLLRASTV